MLNKRALNLVAVSLPVLALGFGCSDDENGDGGSGAGGPTPPVVGNGGQNPVVIPGTGNTGSGGASTFDGGATPSPLKRPR